MIIKDIQSRVRQVQKERLRLGIGRNVKPKMNKIRKINPEH